MNLAQSKSFGVLLLIPAVLACSSSDETSSGSGPGTGSTGTGGASVGTGSVPGTGGAGGAATGGAGGVAQARASGHAQAPLEGSQERSMVALASVRAALGLRLGRRFRLRAGLAADYAFPEVTLRLAGQDTATWGRPNVTGGVALEWFASFQSEGP